MAITSRKGGIDYAQLKKNPSFYQTAKSPHFSDNNPSSSEDRRNMNLNSGCAVSIEAKPYIFYDYKNVERVASHVILDTPGGKLVLPNVGVMKITTEMYRAMQKEEKASKVKVFNFNIEEENARDYMQIDYSKPRRDVVFDIEDVMTGSKNNDTFIIYERPMKKNGIGYLKNTTDTLLYKVPYDWAIINGYNPTFVNDYLKVINGFGFGRVELDSLKEDKETFGRYPVSNEYNGISNNLFYTFKVDTESTGTTNLLLELIRNLHTSNIPGLFMQLLNNNSVDLPPFSMYLFTEVITQYERGISRITGVGLTASGQHFMLPNLVAENNTVDSLLNLCESNGNTVNDNFTYICVTRESFANIVKAFDKKDYRSALNHFLKNIKF